MRSAVRYLWADRWGRLAIMATLTGLLFMVGVVTWVPMLYAIPELRTLRRAA